MHDRVDNSKYIEYRDGYIVERSVSLKSAMLGIYGVADEVDENLEHFAFLGEDGRHGRVLAHERVYLPDPNSTLLIVGYQAAGTIGRQLIEGVKTLELHKERISVRAKVETLYGYSAHRDGEGLLEFANKAGAEVEEIFAVHGEPAATAFLCQRIRDYLGIKATAPLLGDKVMLQL